MTSKDESNETAQAREALDSIKSMERKALWHAIPPRWFGVALSVLAGTMVALSVADLRSYHIIVIVMMTAVLVYQSQTTGVSLKSVPPKMLGLALIILVPMFFLLIVATQMFGDTLGPVGAPLLAGLVLAVSVYALSVHERMGLIARIDAGDQA